MSSPFELSGCSAPRPRALVEGHEPRWLQEGWEAAACAADADEAPAGLQSRLEGLSYSPARVPGTAAGVLRDAGLWRAGEARDFDAEDWWFRTSFAAARVDPREQVVLRLDGLATIADVYLNGELVLHSESMFEPHCLDVGARLAEDNELAIRFRALAPLLRAPRRPRARWRTRLVASGNLRFYRTMLLGRAPGFAPGPAAVGPWRGICLERRRLIAVEDLALRARLRAGSGELSVRARLRPLGGTQLRGAQIELSGSTGTHTAALSLSLSPADAGSPAGQALELSGELAVPDAAPWWPHTHGSPSLYEARLLLDGAEGSIAVQAGRVGFRRLTAGASADHEPERDGIDLHVNGVAVFARGAVWTPVDAIGLAPDPQALRGALEQARDAGMNMLRVPGTSAYEQQAFYELCDELGMLVWQDFMFANLDYPIADEAFRASVQHEAQGLLSGLASHPSVAVVCGNSEVEQQVAMLGLDPALGRGELFGELLPALLAESGADAAYLPSAPCGGELPFRPDRGVANYYGVGGYRRPLEDARRSGVRFAAECLAFSNVPDEAAIEEMLPDSPASLAVHHPRWKAGVPRDVGSGWDFEDVRDHYLSTLFGVDPGELRRVEHERYLELSRAVTGEIMAEVFGEWRRAASSCAGGLVLWMRDVLPGAGWGVIDHRGEPKVAYHHLRRALAPVAVWTTDEGLGGVRVHAANDGQKPLLVCLRVALYRDFEHGVGEARETIELPAHSVSEWDAETLLGGFVDVSWAYRFGPPAQDLIVASLESQPGGGAGAGPAGAREAGDLLSQSVRCPAGRPLSRSSAAQMGLTAAACLLKGGGVGVSVRTRRFAYGVRLHVPGFIADEDAFCVEPGAQRTLALRPRAPESAFAGGSLTALNLAGRVALAVGDQAPAEGQTEVSSPRPGARTDGEP